MQRLRFQHPTNGIVHYFMLPVAVFILSNAQHPLLAWQPLPAGLTPPVVAISASTPAGESEFDSGDLDSAKPVSIEALVDQLNSRDFSMRESATAEIIKLGKSALPVLTKRYFDQNPETNYRIRKALEGIASGGDESTFLKSAAILLTLYSTGDDLILEQIAQLRTKWQTIRSQKVIQSLKKTGVEVTQRQGYAGQIGGRAVLIDGARVGQNLDAQKPKPVKRTAQQKQELVDAILNRDADGNRSFVFDLMPPLPRVNLGLAVGLSSQNSKNLAGTTVKFPKDWANGKDDLGLLSEISQIDGRIFVDVVDSDFSPAQWNALSQASNIAAMTLSLKDSDAQLPSRLPGGLQTITLQELRLNDDLVDAMRGCDRLQQIIFQNCDLDRQLAQKINDFDSLKNVICQFESFEVSPEQVLALSELEDLRILRLESTTVNKDALSNLRRLSSLSLLAITNMPATSEFFASVDAIPQLKSIQFKGCRLDIPAYKRVDAKKRIRMSFEAQAFLGIQGSGAIQPNRPGGGDTMVSLVIPDSAAQQAGIVAGDFINKIEGEEVESFNDVRLHITQFAAGDKVEIEVLRDGQPKSLSVTLRDFKTARKF